jgi:putative addiction module component (TIGR02574 family)
LDPIVEETRQLPTDVLARHGGIKSDMEEFWRAEIGRRAAEIEAGTAPGIPVEASRARIRKIAGR